jgi:prophage regulatory protein
MNTNNSPLAPETSRVGARPRKPGAVQPVALIAVDGALLKMTTVSTVTGRCPASIYRDVKAGTFPQPVKMGARCTRWRADDVRAWLNSFKPEGATS